MQAGSDQFNDGFLRTTKVGEEYSAVVGAAQPLAERKFPVDCAAFPGLPSLRIVHVLGPQFQHESYSMPPSRVTVMTKAPEPVLTRGACRGKISQHAG